MHITIDHTEFLKTLEMVARVSTKHLTLPVLQCVVLEAKNNEVTIKATNLEIGIEGSVPATVHTEGVVGVNASTLLQTVTLLSQKEVTLQTVSETLSVETKSSKTSITTMSIEEFPHIPKIDGEGQEVQGKSFAFGIKTAGFAASQSSIKPELGSVYIYQKKEQTLTFVATDSFRLVEKTTPQQGVVLESGVLVPAKNAFELARVCELQEENPKLLMNENQCTLTFSRVYITSRLTTGSFPDYEQIIPKEYSTHTTLLVDDLQTALKKTNVFLNKFMQLTMSVSASKLALTSRGDLGETAVDVPASTEGESLVLSFNQRYVGEILPHIQDESAIIHFAGIGRPIVIEGVHDKSVRYLVMPMNK